MLPGNFLKVGIVADDKTKKGITSAQKNINTLNKSVHNLGKTFAAVFAAQKIAAFGKASVKAFIDDEKAVTKLNTAVKNLGLELSAPSINRYIDNLSAAAGVADDQLRPAFQALITTTGSVTASQKALQQAIDVSAGSGIALQTVAQDLANAYVGNTKGLKKYNLGLTQAQLKSASFADISEKLNKQFSGANAAYLETYAGKIGLLSVAAGEAQEKIGQGIIDLALAVSGAQDVEDLINKISSATDFAIARLDNFIEGWKILKTILNSSLGDFKKNIQAVQVEEFNRRLKRDYMKVWGSVNIPGSAKQTAAEKAAEAAAKKRAADAAKASAKNTAELKKQNALKKSASIFDLEQIQVIAALKGKLSDEDRKRLELQLAIMTNNDALASKLTYEIAKAQGLGTDLAKFLADLPAAKNPFASWEAYLDMLAEKARQIASLTINAPLGTAAAAASSGVGVSSNVMTNVPVTGFTPPPTGTYGTPTGAVQGPQVIELKITGDGDLTNTIAKNLMQQSLSSGNQTYVNRRTGGFE